MRHGTAFFFFNAHTSCKFLLTTSVMSKHCRYNLKHLSFLNLNRCHPFLPLSSTGRSHSILSHWRSLPIIFQCRHPQKRNKVATHNCFIFILFKSLIIPKLLGSSRTQNERINATFQPAVLYCIFFSNMCDWIDANDAQCPQSSPSPTQCYCQLPACTDCSGPYTSHSVHKQSSHGMCRRS